VSEVLDNRQLLEKQFGAVFWPHMVDTLLSLLLWH